MDTNKHESETSAEPERDELKAMEQMDLALGDFKLCIDYEQPIKNYTAERALRDRPDECKAAIHLLGNGFKHKTIAKRLHFDVRTIDALRYRCMTEVAQQKEEARKVIFPLVMMSAERLAEEIPNMPGDKVSIALGITADKWMQLAGMPSAHIRVDHHFDMAKGISDLKEILSTAAARPEKVVKAQVVEPASITNGETE